VTRRLGRVIAATLIVAVLCGGAGLLYLGRPAREKGVDGSKYPGAMTTGAGGSLPAITPETPVSLGLILTGAGCLLSVALALTGMAKAVATNTQAVADLKDTVKTLEGRFNSHTDK
jgi:hypothetical protein